MKVLFKSGQQAASGAQEDQCPHRAGAEAFCSALAVLVNVIEAKDPYTRGHSESVARLAVEVARRLGFEGKALEEMHCAALLHDIGKIGVPDSVLRKPGKLLPEEFAVIKRHSQIGSALLSYVPELSHIAPIIRQHHERMDGSGYPDGHAGEDISLAARIIGVVDAFDAMTSTRPYREPVAPLCAVAELYRCAGTQFDPQVVSALENVVCGQEKAVSH